MNESQRVTLLDLGRPWYWPSEVATICQVSTKTVYRWIERGTVLPLLKVRPFKIPAEELKKILCQL
ncbi:MAG: helix-turn-helix domain-containing protein [Burkholderiales bacterium]